MIKVALIAVSTLQYKMFLSNQIHFLYMFEPNVTNVYHIEIILQ